MKISCVILTSDNERTIRECLDSIKWCDDVVIMDDYSQDQTLLLIKKYNNAVRIYRRELDDNFADRKSVV